jgi:hypothetical protein
MSFNVAGAEYITFLLMLLYVFVKYDGNIVIGGQTVLIGIFCLGAIFNAIVSKYVWHPMQFMFSFIVYLMPCFIYIVFSSIRNCGIDVYRQLKDFSLIILFSIIHAWIIELVFSLSELGVYPSGFVPHKDVGYVGVWASIMCLYAYYFRARHRNYSVVLFCISIAYIVKLSLIKSFLSVAMGVSYNVVFQSNLKSSRFYAIAAVNSIAALAVISNQQVATKMLEYLHFYFTSENAAEAPRNALYLAAFKMISEYFPFGIGIGGFGSYGAIIYESMVYVDFDLSRLHGLNNLALAEGNSANFLLDVYWSSVIGELGFVNTILYLLIIVLPIAIMRRSILLDKITRDFMVIVFLVITIQSLVLAVFMQISFVFFIYSIAGLYLFNKRS